MAEEIRLLLKISGPDLDRDEIVVGRQGLRAGRSSENSLVLNHTEISRQHLRISWREDDKFIVEDLNSSNGVWLNDTRLIARVPAELNIGDVIRLGPYLLRVDSYVYAQATPAIQRRMDDSPVEDIDHRHIVADYIPGVPSDRSTWLTYLPSIYSNDEFLGRFLLIFESMLSPVTWRVDNFDLYLTPDIAPIEWLRWMSSWFDITLLPEFPIETQRRVMAQLGWLFMRRGTPSGLTRLLELHFGVTPEIIESEPCHFTVRLDLGEQSVKREVVERLIDSQRPAFASYTLEII